MTIIKREKRRERRPLLPGDMSKTSSSLVITCKAAVCWGMGMPPTVEEIQVEPPKSSEIRVKMLYSSLCHTDILCSNGFPSPVYPRVLGHEGVGVVESVGDGIKDMKEGELVIPVFLGECQECENCTSGKTNICLKYPLITNGLMPDGTSRMLVRGQRLYHVLSCATWSEYMVIDVNYAVKIDPSIHLPYATLLSCGFSTGFGSAWMEAKVEEGSSVAVLGLGAVGLGAIEGAKVLGAAKIIGVDINERKKEKAETFGMTDFINPDASEGTISEKIRDLTSGRGVDYCFECTGISTLINEALNATKTGKGQTIVVGAGNDADVSVNFLSLLCGRSLKGCLFGGLKVKSHLPIIVHKCNNKELHLQELLTHEVSLQDINKAFPLSKQPDCVKVLIKI